MSKNDYSALHTLSPKADSLTSLHLASLDDSLTDILTRFTLLSLGDVLKFHSGNFNLQVYSV